jgi:hypothetical protein
MNISFRLAVNGSRRLAFIFICSKPSKLNPSDLPRWLDEDTYRRDILPLLSKFTVKSIRLTLGVSQFLILDTGCLWRTSRVIESRQYW